MRIAIATALLFVAGSLVAGPRCASAESEIDFTVCAAIYPCDDNGDILPAFNDRSSPCYKTYAAQCYEVKTDLLKQCQVTSAKIRKAKRRAKKR